MANRVLRDWTTSEKIHTLSAEAERFFTRLIMKVDDFGRYYGNPKLLAASLFPLHDHVSVDPVVGWLKECVDASLIKKYNVDGKDYVEIILFDQKGLKVRKAKFPPSSEEDRQELVMGYVYVIGESLDKPVKIGFSMNPWSRLKEISANHPSELSVLISFRAEKRIESLIHLQLKHRRVKNEWFVLTGFESDLLKSVAAGDMSNEHLINTLRSNYEQLRTTTLPETETEVETEVETKPNSNPALYAAVCMMFGRPYQIPGERLPALANWYKTIEDQCERILQVYSESDAIKQVKAYVKYCADNKRKMIGTNFKVAETIISADWIKLSTPSTVGSTSIRTTENRKVYAG